MISDDSGSESSGSTRSNRARRLRRALSRTPGALPRRTVVSERISARRVPPWPRASPELGPGIVATRGRTRPHFAWRLRVQPLPASPPPRPLGPPPPGARRRRRWRWPGRRGLRGPGPARPRQPSTWTSPMRGSQSRRRAASSGPGRRELGRGAEGGSSGRGSA